MCKFFSCISDGNGEIFYLNAIQHEETKGKYESPDSHTSIADYYGFKGSQEDKMNKYEFNPVTRVFTVDQINTTDDSEAIKRKCQRMDFKKIVPALIIHPLFNPVKSRRCKKVVKSDLDLLAQWVSVWVSVRVSVRDSVWDSVRASVGDSVRDSVWASVWAYTGSLFTNINWNGLRELWLSGRVPSFDGKTWRIHIGPGGRIAREYQLVKGKMTVVKNV